MSGNISDIQLGVQVMNLLRGRICEEPNVEIEYGDRIVGYLLVITFERLEVVIGQDYSCPYDGLISLSAPGQEDLSLHLKDWQLSGENVAAIEAFLNARAGNEYLHYMMENPED